jgi:hypothetical protein
MKPQRPQRKTLWPQKDLFIKEIKERRGAWRRSGGSIEGRGKEIRGHRGGENAHFFNSPKINLFSVYSVVGF